MEDHIRLDECFYSNLTVYSTVGTMYPSPRMRASDTLDNPCRYYE